MKKSILLLIIGLLKVSFLYGQNYNGSDIPNDFRKFSKDLKSAIQQNDTTFIFARIDTGVFNGFGYNKGIQVFRGIWKDPNGQIGKELLRALQLGPALGADQATIFVPWIWLSFPDSLDAFTSGYVLEENTPLYPEPDTSHSVITSLPAGWIEVKEWGSGFSIDDLGNPQWVSVTADSITGYISAASIRSVIDYRFWFEKQKGKWLLMGWAAGD